MGEGRLDSKFLAATGVADDCFCTCMLQELEVAEAAAEAGDPSADKHWRESFVTALNSAAMHNIASAAGSRGDDGDKHRCVVDVISASWGVDLGICSAVGCCVSDFEAVAVAVHHPVLTAMRCLSSLLHKESWWFCSLHSWC